MEVEENENVDSVSTLKLTIRERFKVMILGAEAIAHSVGLLPPLLPMVPITPKAEITAKVCNVYNESDESQSDNT